MHSYFAKFSFAFLIFSLIPSILITLLLLRSLSVFTGANEWLYSRDDCGESIYSWHWLPRFGVSMYTYTHLEGSIKILTLVLLPLTLFFSVGFFCHHFLVYLSPRFQHSVALFYHSLILSYSIFFSPAQIVSLSLSLPLCVAYSFSTPAPR